MTASLFQERATWGDGSDGGQPAGTLPRSGAALTGQ